jgi:hypothetical protein
VTKVLIDLCEEDRERLGAPGQLVVDPSTISMRETITLQKGVEIGHGVSSYDTVVDWLDALRNSVENPFAYLVLVWLGLRRAGVDKDLADVDAALSKMKVEFVSETTDAGEPGKDPSTPETTS